MMLIVKSIFKCVQLCCEPYTTILDLVMCLGGGQRVIILVTFATMNHIQKLWKVKLDLLTIELICLLNIVRDIVGCIMVYQRNGRDLWSYKWKKYKSSWIECQIQEKRIDVQNMNFRHMLHLKQRLDGSYDKPRAFFSLSPNERDGFYDFLKSVKYPDGYAANI